MSVPVPIDTPSTLLPVSVPAGIVRQAVPTGEAQQALEAYRSLCGALLDPTADYQEIGRRKFPKSLTLRFDVMPQVTRPVGYDKITAKG